MPLVVLQDKLQRIDESYYGLIGEFLDFIAYRQKEAKNGLDEAIEEVESGQTEHFKSFSDFKVAMNSWNMN